MARNGKRLSQAYSTIDREKDYGLAEAVKIVKDVASETKFDETRFSWVGYSSWYGRVFIKCNDIYEY